MICPNCKKPVLAVRGAKVTVSAPAGQFNGLGYSCMNCQAALGVQIDPVAIKTDIVEEVVEQLSRVLRA